MYRIGIAYLEKIETLKDLANEFFMPGDYMMETLNNEEEISSFINNGHTVINKDKNLDIEGAKIALFNELVEFTGYRPIWGTLTGVRPVKLTGELIERSGKTEARKKLENYYKVSSEKIDSLIDIYDYQIDTFGYPNDNSMSVYIGIPFCPTRCLYCSFASNQVERGEINRYLKALIKEISGVGKIIGDNGYIVESIYIGGGTPTTLDLDQLNLLLENVNEHFVTSDVKEFTLEAGRPDTIDKDKLKLINDMGVDRISINPQSMKKETLIAIGRSHTPYEIINAFNIAKEVGFKSINCDLIAGLPNEDIQDMEYSLNKILGLKPENITVHSLSVKRASRLKEEDPNYHYKKAKITRNMISFADTMLKDSGYKPYYLYRQKHMAGSGENTGYSIPGKEGLYNVRIMDEHQNIMALGAGGISKKYFPGENRLERVPNVTNYEIYIDRITEMIDRKRKEFVNAY